MDTFKDEYIVYIGDFDLRNENVQSFLVRNNGKIFNKLGYKVLFFGINTKVSDFEQVVKLPQVVLENGNQYIELPNTLSFAGIKMIHKINDMILHNIERFKAFGEVKYVITYQAPSYSCTLNKIVKWCDNNNVPYVVNCADLPVFRQQPLYRRIVMKFNWDYLHRINKKNSRGIIAVSNYIKKYYENGQNNSIVIPPLFDMSNRSPQKISEDDITTFIYAGTPFKITGKKVDPQGMKDRLDKIIDIFAALSENNVKYRFMIVGIDKDEYCRGIPQHQKLLEIEKQIVFLGRLNHNQTLELVSQSDFSINFRDENHMTKAGFSTKIVESVSMGTPVIINDISDTFLYLKNGKSGFKLKGNIEEDIAMLTNLCKMEKKERIELKKSVYEERVFDYNNYVEKMRLFLNSIHIGLN